MSECKDRKLKRKQGSAVGKLGRQHGRKDEKW